MKEDPICHMAVREEDAITTACDGVTYYFCSIGCRDKFLTERACKLPRTSYDLIIVGGGPAGLTAAVYASTLKMEAFIITRDLGGQAVDSTKIENYLGFDFITGPELVEKFQYQLLHSQYIDHLMSDVEKIELLEDGFQVTTAELKTYTAKTLIVATGMTRRRLDIDGEERFQRKGLFYGNIQDLSFVQGEDVAVVGGGNSALQIVENLHVVARKIYLISDTPLVADPTVIERVNQIENVSRYEGYKVVELAGETTLSRITIREMAKAQTIPLSVKGLFIAIGLRPNSSLVAPLVNVNEQGEIVVGPDCSTSREGLFAAGDVTDAFGKRIIIASGEGAKAAMAARQFILRLRKKVM